MARPRRIDQALVAHAQKVVATATDVHQLRSAQAILLPALLGTSLETTATLLGVGRATVPRLQAHFGAEVTAKPLARKHWGGRRHALLPVAEEQAFVSKWRAKAEAGELVVLSAVRADLEQQLGRKVAAEVFYRLMHRHRWRKVAPDTRHPKSDALAQEEWKKNFTGSSGDRVEVGAGGAAKGAFVFPG
jgi:transposase